MRIEIDEAATGSPAGEPGCISPDIAQPGSAGIPAAVARRNGRCGQGRSSPPPDTGTGSRSVMELAPGDVDREVAAGAGRVIRA